MKCILTPQEVVKVIMVCLGSFLVAVKNRCFYLSNFLSTQTIVAAWENSLGKENSTCLVKEHWSFESGWNLQVGRLQLKELTAMTNTWHQAFIYSLVLFSGLALSSS